MSLLSFVSLESAVVYLRFGDGIFVAPGRLEDLKGMCYETHEVTVSQVGTKHMKNENKYIAKRFNFEETRFLCCQGMPSRACVLRLVKAKTACISRTR